MVFIRHTVTDHTPYASRTSYKYLPDRTASINDINQSEFELGTQSPGDEVGDKSGKQTEGTEGGRTCNKCSV